MRERVSVCVRGWGGAHWLHNWIDSSHRAGCRGVNWCAFAEMPSRLCLRLLLSSSLPPPSAVILIGRERAAIGAAVVVALSLVEMGIGAKKKKLMKSEIPECLFSSASSFILSL